MTVRDSGTIIVEIDHGCNGVKLLAEYAIDYTAYRSGEEVTEVYLDEPIMQSLTLTCGGIDRHLEKPIGFALSKWVAAFGKWADAHCLEATAADDCRDKLIHKGGVSR